MGASWDWDCGVLFSALALVKWLIGFVGRNDYRVFGWYRIIFGTALFAASWLGWISF